MNRIRMERELEQCYRELCALECMTEEEACRCWNTDSKEDIRLCLEAEAEQLETSLREPEYDYEDDELEKERTAICRSQGLSRWC